MSDKYYILKRYYPEIEDDDNEEIIYITDNYKEAVKTAAWIHKADLEELKAENDDEDDRYYYYNTIIIEKCNNEKAYKEYCEQPNTNEVFYYKTIRVWLTYNEDTKRYFNTINDGEYDCYLTSEENTDYVGLPDDILSELRDGLRLVQIYRYPNSKDANMTFKIIKENVNNLDDYDEQIHQLIEEATEYLNDGENIIDIENYIFETFDNRTSENKSKRI